MCEATQWSYKRMFKHPMTNNNDKTCSWFMVPHWDPPDVSPADSPLCHERQPKSIPVCHRSTRWFTKSASASFLDILNNLSGLMKGAATHRWPRNKKPLMTFPVCINRYCWLWKRNATMNKPQIDLCLGNVMDAYFGPLDKADVAWCEKLMG